MENWSQFIDELVKSGLAYVWFTLLGIWGGTASYLSRVKRRSIPFSLIELLVEWVISGLSGFLTALCAVEVGASLELTAVAAGIGGHLGGRGINMLERALINKAKKINPDGH